MLDYVQGYHKRGSVTRANLANRYLGRDGDIKWAMMLSTAVLQKDCDDDDDQPGRRCLRNDERGRDDDSMRSNEDWQ